MTPEISRTYTHCRWVPTNVKADSLTSDIEMPQHRIMQSNRWRTQKNHSSWIFGF